jgi:excisionase family DNA binding protein
MSQPTQLLTIKDTAAILAVSTRTVSRLVASGELESIRIGGARRIRSGALEKYINTLQRQQREHAVGF